MREELLRKTNVLKQYESYGYSVAFYLLEDEQLAVKASVQALLELLGDEDFFHRTHDHQKQQTKRVFIKHSLQVRSTNFPMNTKRQHA